jgi:hypothetical protein
MEKQANINATIALIEQRVSEISMSRPKSPERILLDQERAIRRERREQIWAERGVRRAAREAKRQARESYDAKNGGDHEMKCSEFKPSLRCKLCGEGSIEVAVSGFGFVCWKCEPEAKQIVQTKEDSGPAPDLLGQGKELGGERRVAQLALFES